MNQNGFLVLDTNIWVYSTRLLSTPLGAAVIYSLSQTKRKLALPEIIEEEIRKHTFKRGSEAVAEIHKHYRLLEQLMGSRDDYRVPSNDEFTSRVDSRVSELGALIHRTGFNISHAKSALRRVLDESPPNGYKNQQFKDSVIWESILELANEVDVDFVTEDKAFFQDGKPSKGLASNLIKDTEKTPGKIRVFYELSEYLKVIKKEILPLDNEKVIKKIDESIHVGLYETSVDKGYKLGDISHSEMQAFLTEQPDIVAIEFEISFSTSDVLIPETKDIVEADLVVKGNCECNITSYQVTDIEFQNINMVTKDGVGVPLYGNIFLKVGSIYQGRKTIPYKLKELLN